MGRHSAVTTRTARSSKSRAEKALHAGGTTASTSSCPAMRYCTRHLLACCVRGAKKAVSCCKWRRERDSESGNWGAWHLHATGRCHTCCCEPCTINCCITPACAPSARCCTARDANVQLCTGADLLLESSKLPHTRGLPVMWGLRSQHRMWKQEVSTCSSLRQCLVRHGENTVMCMQTTRVQPMHHGQPLM